MMFIMPDKKHEELAKKVLKKYDKESDVIEHKGLMAKVVAVLAVRSCSVPSIWASA